MLMALLATVQFGKYFAQFCRSWPSPLASVPRKAAKTSGLSTVERRSPWPTNVVQAIDQQLAAFGLTRRIIVLDHNVGGTPVSLVEPTGAPLPSKLSPVPPGKYVRILITVPKADVMPELLKVFGLHLAGWVQDNHPLNRVGLREVSHVRKLRSCRTHLCRIQA
ncbi:MAG: hypothetical protein KatS3mg112_0514 [Thermogutta sp.]|nr:MAG: hypothetical protein KatS3mg112_0514 [Thermogutta sp.]